MFSSRTERSVTAALLTVALTNAYGGLRMANLMAEQQLYEPGVTLADSWFFRMYIAWPILSLFLALAIAALQLYCEYLLKTKNWRHLPLLLVLVLVIPSLAALPSYAINTYPGFWDNQDRMLQYWSILDALIVLAFVNLTAYVVEKAKARA